MSASQSTDPDAADKTAALRQLISEDEIFKEVVIKLKTVRIEQKGPIAFYETTTSKSIFVEDLNRCLSFYADESDDQTRRVLDSIADSYDPDHVDTDELAIEARHITFQRSLQFADVRVPFARMLLSKLPLKLETRRASKQLLAAIEAITFLHQHVRERDEKDRLISTYADYSVARRLLHEPLTESLGVGAGIYPVFEKLKSAFGNRGATFTAKTVIQAGCCSNKMAWSRVAERLSKLGTLKIVTEAKGNQPAVWGWQSWNLKPVLPTPDELREACDDLRNA